MPTDKIYEFASKGMTKFLERLVYNKSILNNINKKKSLFINDMKHYLKSYSNLSNESEIISNKHPSTYSNSSNNNENMNEIDLLYDKIQEDLELMNKYNNLKFQTLEERIKIENNTIKQKHSTKLIDTSVYQSDNILTDMTFENEIKTKYYQYLDNQFKAKLKDRNVLLGKDINDLFPDFYCCICNDDDYEINDMIITCLVIFYCNIRYVK